MESIRRLGLVAATLLLAACGHTASPSSSPILFTTARMASPTPDVGVPVVGVVHMAPTVVSTGATTPLVQATPAPERSSGPLFDGGSVTVGSMVTAIFARYDRNGDGKIALTHGEGAVDWITNPDERVRPEHVVADGDSVVTSSDEVYTMRALFYVADANNDRCVTPAELKAVIDRFDTGHTGTLKSTTFWSSLFGDDDQPLDRFNRQYGEKLVAYGSVTP